uniref:Oxidative stress-responsive serine-rich protein 1 n=1 Tax=Monodelphis domestica TaxID=13616 RepID=A0A5F8H7R0_MONDO
MKPEAKDEETTCTTSLFIGELANVGALVKTATVETKAKTLCLSKGSWHSSTRKTSRAVVRTQCHRCSKSPVSSCSKVYTLHYQACIFLPPGGLETKVQVTVLTTVVAMGPIHKFSTRDFTISSPSEANHTQAAKKDPLGIKAPYSASEGKTKQDSLDAALTTQANLKTSNLSDYQLVSKLNLGKPLCMCRQGVVPFSGLQKIPSLSTRMKIHSEELLKDDSQSFLPYGSPHSCSTWNITCIFPRTCPIWWKFSAPDSNKGTLIYIFQPIMSQNISFCG